MPAVRKNQRFKPTESLAIWIPTELRLALTKKCKGRPASAQIRDLISAWVGRPDLTVVDRKGRAVVRRQIINADIAVEMIRNGIHDGWSRLFSAISRLIQTGNTEWASHYVGLASRVCKTHGSGGELVRTIEEFHSLLSLKRPDASVRNGMWTWEPGPPDGVGTWLVLKNGSLSVEYVHHLNDHKCSDQSIEWHLLIPRPPMPEGETAES